MSAFTEAAHHVATSWEEHRWSSLGHSQVETKQGQIDDDVLGILKIEGGTKNQKKDDLSRRELNPGLERCRAK